jgi:hypothetical protein
MDLWQLVQTTADFLVTLFAFVGIFASIVSIEYGRYLFRKRRWMSQHGHIVGTRSRVVSNADGRTVLENGTELPAQRDGDGWRYRHKPGEVVEILGYPSFQNISADPPITILASGMRPR